MSVLCKSCGGEVTWSKQGGKWCCYNAGTNTDHWDECSRRRFEAIKSTGQAFKSTRGKEKVEGYGTHLKRSGEQLTRSAFKSVRGRQYKPSGDCTNCVPPWEVCPRPCPDRLTNRPTERTR